MRRAVGIGIIYVLIILTAVAVFYLFNNDNKESTKTSITNTTREEWQFIDAGPFKLSLPSGWQFHKLPGFDSYVGEIVGDGATLEFDFGRYSNSLVKENDSRHDVIYKTIDGYRAKIVAPKAVGDGITGIYFDELENRNKLSLYGSNLDLFQQRTALNAFLSIEFKRLWKNGGDDE